MVLLTSSTETSSNSDGCSGRGLNSGTDHATVQSLRVECVALLTNGLTHTSHVLDTNFMGCYEQPRASQVQAAVLWETNGEREVKAAGRRKSYQKAATN